MPGATLLSLPREIRDQILDLCLTTALPSPPNQIYTLRSLSFSDLLASSAQKQLQPLVNIPAAPRTNSGGLLLTSRQISAETRDALERLNGHGKLDYVMRFRIEEEEDDTVGGRERCYVDWAVLPTKSWLKTSRAAKATATGKGTQKIDANTRPAVNLIIEFEKTMRAKPAGPRSRDQGVKEGQQRLHDGDGDGDGQHIFEPPPTLTALYRRYHFLCRPEYRPPLLPPTRPTRRSLLVAADHGVLLLHWTLGDMIARVVDEGPCFASRAQPPSSSSASSSPSTSSSSSSSPQQPRQHPTPFTLTLRNRTPTPSSSPASPPRSSTTQPLATPLLEFLPFYLHSAKLTHTPFGALLSRGLLRGFALDAPRPPRSDAQTRSQGHAACPVPEGCCGKEVREGANEGGLHWACDVVRDVRGGGGVERDYDDDW